MGANPLLNFNPTAITAPGVAGLGVGGNQTLAGGLTAQQAQTVNLAPVAQAGFSNLSPAELQSVFGELLSQILGIGKKGNNVASQYLQSSGSFVVQPLEQSAYKHKADDSEYWTALGYEA